MNTENLTPFQQKLVDELVKEFTKINPKPNPNGVKRFTLDTISECLNEENRFKETITKSNLTMIKVFIGQLETELKAFKKEFGKVLDIQMGHNKYGGNFNYNLETLKSVTNSPLNNDEHKELYLFFVSKTKKFNGQSNWDYCNDKRYVQVFVGFKRERVSITLESGKNVSVCKIVGLEYRTNSYLYKKDGITKSTLDELIQESKEIQTKIVEIAG